MKVEDFVDYIRRSSQNDTRADTSPKYVLHIEKAGDVNAHRHACHGCIPAVWSCLELIVDILICGKVLQTSCQERKWTKQADSEEEKLLPAGTPRKMKKASNEI